MLSSRGLSTLTKELMTATRVMLSSSNELTIPVSDSENVNKRKLIKKLR